jgi:hypothetical protein
MTSWQTRIATLFTGLALFVGVPTAAQPFLEGTGVAGRVSTLGWGVEIIQAIRPQVNLRVGVNRYRGTFTGTEDQVDYTAAVRLRSVNLLADWHPYDGVFRVTGGLLHNGNEVTVVGAPNRPLRIGNASYAPSELGSLTYEIRFRKITPYRGIGFGNALAHARRFSVVLDVGVVFHGFPDVRMSASGPSAGRPEFQANLSREERDLEMDLRPLRYYPVLAFGFTYRFW